MTTTPAETLLSRYIHQTQKINTRTTTYQNFRRQSQLNLKTSENENRGLRLVTYNASITTTKN